MSFRIPLRAMVLVAAAHGLDGQAFLDPGTLYKQASPAVVLIEAIGPNGKPTKTGSGVLVSADGKLLTNYHVISHVKQATVRLANGDAYDLVEVIAVDKRKDIAFLKIPAVDLHTANLGRSNSVEVGQTVYSIGSPMGLQNTLSLGLVSGIRPMDGYQLFQMSAPISPGSSGGPVFNSSGEVIGIAVLTLEAGQNLNFAIPIDYARGMLSISQTQPLASIYEPDPVPEPASLARVEPTKVEPTKVEPTKVSATAPLQIPEEMRKGSFAFLEKEMGVWNIEDAKGVLGEPTRQRDALVGTKADGIIYAFPDPTGGMRELELNFSMGTSRLRAVYAYPHKETLQEAQAVWGRKYKETKNPNGTHSYLYQDRRLIVVTNANGDVILLGVYLP